jgi:hypothetical protein
MEGRPLSQLVVRQSLAPVTSNRTENITSVSAKPVIAVNDAAIKNLSSLPSSYQLIIGHASPRGVLDDIHLPQGLGWHIVTIGSPIINLYSDVLNMESFGSKSLDRQLGKMQAVISNLPKLSPSPHLRQL